MTISGATQTDEGLEGGCAGGCGLIRNLVCVLLGIGRVASNGFHVTTDTARRYRLIGLIVVLGAVFVFAGYATFEQWSGLVGSLMGGITGT